MRYRFPIPTKVVQFLIDSKKRLTLSRGGTRSGKTYGTCMLAVNWLVGGTEFGGKVWSIVRATLPALKASAYRDVLEIIDCMHLHNEITHNKSEMTFKHKGRMIEFFSLDDVNKVKSRKRDICQIVECNETTYDVFLQLDIRTTTKMILDWNPSDISAWMKVEIEDKRMHLKRDVDLIISTYKDNPHLTLAERQNIEYLAEVDPDLWAVFGLGEYGQVKDIIFRNWDEEQFDIEADYVYLGIDFGFSYDPCAVTLIGKSGNHIWLKELIYERGLLNGDIVDRLEEMGYKDIPAVADSAEPKSIAELNALGMSVSKAVKGPDSVRAGILLMKTFKLHIDPISVNLKKELRVYKWSDKKAGVPIDKFNHSIDGIRYVISKHFKSSGGFGFGGILSNSTNRP